MMGEWGFSAGWDVWAGVLAIVSAGAVLGGIALIVLALFGRPLPVETHRSSKDEALRTLDERHSRGELTGDQYRQMRRDLEPSTRDR